MRKLAILAIRLYPYDFRSAFAAEMIAILAERPPRFHEPVAICWRAAREWISKLTTDKYVRARALPDLRRMRPAGISQEEWFLRKPWGSVTSASR